jgi:hypothetical protein
MMKPFIISIFLLSISFTLTANDTAINAVKSHKEVILFLADKSLNNYQINYEQIELGDICGYMGCQWRKIVSVIVISKGSNSPSQTILALVEGSTSMNNKPKVSFVTLKNNMQNNLTLID